MINPELTEIEFRDPVVRRVVEKFVDRSNVGFQKYGRSLDGERRGGHKDLVGYLNDIQEELMDAVLYIQAAREELSDLHEDELVRKLKENYGSDPKFED
jgi:hypothetical protein|tara:strand:- start:3531 stop:3827 length:297 start_codon:yes stop_codon:yes gene_type:complete